VTLTKVGSGGGVVALAFGGIREECNPSCSREVDRSTPMTFETGPDPSSYVADSSVPCGGPSCTASIESDVAYSVRIEPKPKLTVVANGPGHVTTPAGVDCRMRTCEELLSRGSDLTTHPDAGQALLDWSGCPTASATTCTVGMGGDVTVQARFGNPTPTAEGRFLGTGNSGSGAGQYESWYELRFTAEGSATPLSGGHLEYRFDRGQDSSGWQGAQNHTFVMHVRAPPGITFRGYVTLHVRNQEFPGHEATKQLPWEFTG
jgi:hypothetical protein